MGRDVLAMVEEVVGQIVADVSKDTTAISQHSSVPVMEENEMRNFPERSSEYEKESRRHNETVSVHGQIMVDAM